jgi:hypothetical protein
MRVDLWRDEQPKFTVRDGAMNHSIQVGGDIHGDFRMTCTKKPTTVTISPINRETLFAPEIQTIVAGYHSVEPYITAAMIRHEHNQHGKQAAHKLVSEFIEVVRELGGADTDFTRGNFGDYGDGDLGWVLTELEYDIQRDKDDYEDMMELFSAAYLPQSDVLFEMVSSGNGIRFQNRMRTQETSETYIDIDHAHFVDLFKILVGQAKGGLGRTSPHQQAMLVSKAYDALQ